MPETAAPVFRDIARVEAQLGQFVQPRTRFPFIEQRFQDCIVPCERCHDFGPLLTLVHQDPVVITVLAAQTAELFVPPAQERSTAFQAGSFFFLVQMIAHDGLFSKDGCRAGNLQGSERKPLQILNKFGMHFLKVI